MKLKRFNKETTPVHIGDQSPTVSFYQNGQIHLSSAAMELLHVKTGDKVELFQDEDSPSDWYLGRSEKGFPLRRVKAHNSAGVFQCAYVCRIFRNSIKKAYPDMPMDQRTRCRLAPELQDIDGESYAILITASWEQFVRNTKN